MKRAKALRLLSITQKPLETIKSSTTMNTGLYLVFQWRFYYKMQGMSMLLTATTVEKGKVSNRDFEVPSDYKEMTPEELRQMFGGGQ
jgi:hypothetical protein